VRDHRDAEHRSLALHAEVARLLRSDPTLRDAARSRLPRVPAGYRERWRELLDGPLEQLLFTLADPSEAAAALRQASPFTFALDQATRWRILRATVTTATPTRQAR
jgi:hypothetical protein